MARRTGLVTQHLENISAEVLTEWQDLIGALTKRRQGIYALYRKRKLHYVGLASNLASRLTKHRRDHLKGSWDRFSVYLTIGDEHMRELETLVLRITKPAGNKVKGKFARSENLLPILRRQHREKTRRDEARYLDSRVPSQLGKGKPGVVRTSKATGRRPRLGPYVARAFDLKARGKGKTYRARVRSDGTIRFHGRIYNSPSLAGRAAIGRSTNGWTFWTFERSPGDWVHLEELRRRPPAR